MDERDKNVPSEVSLSDTETSTREPLGVCERCSELMYGAVFAWLLPAAHDPFGDGGRKQVCSECYKLLSSKGSKEFLMKRPSFPELDSKTGKGKIVVPEEKSEDQLQEQQRTTVRRGIKPRTSYVSPSREGKVTITVHVDPELKEAITQLADQSNLTFNEFITAILKREAASPAQQSDQTLHLSEEALEKTREAEKALHRLTVTLSSHSR